MTGAGSRELDVLLVEDDPGDVVLVQEAFAAGALRSRLHHVADGDAALRYLRREGEHADAPRPDLVLLDLNLPRKNGHDVLREVKTDPDLRTVPIVVLTTSEADDDVVGSYDLHANAYVSKPVDFERLVDVVRRIDEFWVSVVRLPPDGPR